MKEHNPSEYEKSRESVKVLEECVALQQKKSRDYQNVKSGVTQADYYPRGIHSINDIINAKMLRIKSVIEAMENDESYSENFESLEDSYKDLINYASFAVSWIRGKMEGQDPETGLFSNGDQAGVPDRQAEDILKDLEKILDEFKKYPRLPYPIPTPDPLPFPRPWPDRIDPATPWVDPYRPYYTTCESDRRAMTAEETVDDWLERNK